MENFFKDKTFVFTGELTLERNYVKSKVILLGGRVTIAPSKKTTYLVVGAEPGLVKLKKAKDLKIKILYETEFIRYLEKSIKENNKITNINVGMTSNEEQVSTDFDDDSLFNPVKEKFNDTKMGTSDTKIDKNIFNNNSIMWFEKYRPKKRTDLIGNPSVISSLAEFLQGKSKFKGALLSGSPGIGKTTSVYVLCKELGLDLIEFNASDIRNKSSIIKNIKDFMNTKSLIKDIKLKNKVILMDEIDGMTSDRGGLTELNTLIKNSEVPIVCICNDRNNLKIRTLANNCLDLKFHKLNQLQVLSRIKTILKKENKIIGDDFLKTIILNSNGDIRYVLNTIQKICLQNTLDLEITEKTISKNIFEVVTECFYKKSINEKIELYFEDYSIIPLFMFENYMKFSFKNLQDFYDSADSLSNGDIIEKLIRGNTQEWTLTPLHGFFTVALPTKNKTLNKRIDFPSWLGQNMKYMKSSRNIKSAKFHSSRIIKADIESFRQHESYLVFLDIITYLKNGKIKEALDVLVEYDFVNYDFINLTDIIINGQILFKEINSKYKTAFTRQYNKLNRNLPYPIEEVKKIKEANVNEVEEDEEEELYIY